MSSSKITVPVERKNYEAPAMIKYGNVAELTRKAPTNSHSDGGNNRS